VGNQVDSACPNHTGQSPSLVGACDGVEGPLLIKGVSLSPSPSSPPSYRPNVIIVYRERS
jgi:hypothetical protein